MDPDDLARRALLATRPWRHTRPVLIGFAGALDGPHGPTRVEIDYVPDRLVAERGGLDAWLAALGPLADAPTEDLALAVLADLNDVLVPRQVRVVLRHGALRVALDDAQPSWDDPDLPARLTRTL